MDLSKIPFLQAGMYRARSGPRDAHQLVIHTTEGWANDPNGAAACAQYFHGLRDRYASAHYVVDSGHVVQCVHDNDEAYGAPGANHVGIHIEHCGLARFTASEWQSGYNAAMLALSAQLAGRLCRIHKIPAKWLTPEQVAGGARGICGHVDVTHAYPHLHGSHTDPGPGFPKAHYVELVAKAAG